MLDFLRQLKVPARLYVANADAAMLARFRATGAIVEERPVAPSDIARRSRVLVHAGNHGTMCLGIRAGIPQVSVPQQLEQMFNARRLERAGAGRTVGWLGRTGELYARHVLGLYEEAGAHERALRLAHATASDFAGDARALSVARILAVIR
jgi:UDP:flavonoid glycosyltransferase YjiC (YdhE family)